MNLISSKKSPSLVNPIACLKLFAMPLFLLFALVFTGSVRGQTSAPATVPFRVGEKITYSVSIDRYAAAGFAEINVVSRGKLNNRDVIELAGRFKTTGLFSAQRLIDESIVSFVTPDTGNPVYVKRTTYSSGLPFDTESNLLETPSSSVDILSLIYRIRFAAAGGALTIIDGERSHSVSYQPVGTEIVNVEAGEFETTIYDVKSDLFTGFGLQSFRVNIDNTGNRVPVQLRAKIDVGEFVAKATSIQILVSNPAPIATAVSAETPVPKPSPVATPTPDTYVDNRPIANEIPFILGEKIDYNIKIGTQQVGRLTVHARERKRFNNVDSLLLTATVTNAQSGIAAFAANDRMSVQVDPLTLLPQKFDTIFTGNLAAFSQTATFNSEVGKVIFGGANSVDVPVGTHSVLSLFFAMRSFRLTPSKVLTDPVNDTRVAVFWGQKPHVFVIRPTVEEVELADGSKLETVVAAITTGDPLLDQLQPKVWISQDARRLPVRIQLGTYRFDIDRTSVEIP